MDINTQLRNAIGRARLKCWAHAAHCTKCFVPIVDEEGNPGLISEACAEGAPILQALIDAEAAYFKARRTA